MTDEIPSCAGCGSTTETADGWHVTVIDGHGEVVWCPACCPDCNREDPGYEPDP